MNHLPDLSITQIAKIPLRAISLHKSLVSSINDNERELDEINSYLIGSDDTFVHHKIASKMYSLRSENEQMEREVKTINYLFAGL